MKTKILILTVVLSFVAALGCNDDNPTGANGVTVADLTGSWTATKFEFTSQANTSQRVDLIQLGGSFLLTVASGGEFTATVSIPGEVPETSTGTIRIENDTLIFDEQTPDDLTAEFTLSGNTLTLTITGDDAEIDFDGDGLADPATLEIVLVRS